MALLLAKTEQGMIEGLHSRNPEVSVFKGIPFAAPPVGDLRWAAPQPPAPWEGVRRAWQFGAIPSQNTDAGPFYSKEFYRCPKPMDEDGLFDLIVRTVNGEYACKSEDIREIAFYKTGVTL